MKFRKLAFAALTLLTMISISPARAAGWFVEKNETDPFDTSKSTFVAGTTSGNDGFVIRCLEGAISLMLTSGPSNASAGDAVDLEIIADNKGVQEESAQVLTATSFFTAIQFGDASTLEYLNGAQKVSVRFTLAGARSTVSFAGGKSFTDVIAKARKACGIQLSESTKSSSLIEPSKHPAEATIEPHGDDTSPQDSAIDNPCDAFEAIRKAIVDETNRALEKQGISIRVTDMILPSANAGYCMVEAHTNVGLNLKLRYRRTAAGIDVSAADELRARRAP
jgi:hypothetical protein